MSEYMLTTIDNPFNPFTEYDDWKVFDRDYEHYCHEVLARNCFVSDAFSDKIQDSEIDAAMDKVLSDPLYAGIYIRVKADSKIIPIPLKDYYKAVEKEFVSNDSTNENSSTALDSQG